MSFPNFFSRYKTESILRYQKSDKKASSGLMRKFTIKKLEFNLRAVFLEKFSYLLFFFNQLETSHFSHRGSVSYKPHLQSNGTQ